MEEWSVSRIGNTPDNKIDRFKFAKFARRELDGNPPEKDELASTWEWFEAKGMWVLGRKGQRILLDAPEWHGGWRGWKLKSPEQAGNCECEKTRVRKGDLDNAISERVNESAECDRSEPQTNKREREEMERDEEEANRSRRMMVKTFNGSNRARRERYREQWSREKPQPEDDDLSRARKRIRKSEDEAELDNLATPTTAAQIHLSKFGRDIFQGVPRTAVTGANLRRQWILDPRRAVEGDEELGIDRQQRRRKAEEQIEGWLMEVGSGVKGKESDGAKDRVFATDGSRYPAALYNDDGRRTVSAACVTTNGGVSAIIPGMLSQVMHGELLGIIIALVQGKWEDREVIKILSDYLPAVRRIREHMTRRQYLRRMTAEGQDWTKIVGRKETERLKTEQWSGRSWYKWIIGIINDMEEGPGTKRKLSIEHVKAHGNLTNATPEQRLNDKADTEARKARTTPISLNQMSWPTFCLDEYATWHDRKGYIESDLYQWVKREYSKQRKERTHGSDYITHLNVSMYEKRAQSTWIYTKSTSDYSLRTQALARGKALMTEWKTKRFFPDSGNTGMCVHCPEALENDHHIFVQCPRYDEARKKSTQEMLEGIDKMELGTANISNLRNILESITQDTNVWPMERTRYYVGLIPSLDEVFTNSDDHQNREETAHRVRLRKFIHTSAIRTAGYIWSIKMRDRFNRRMSLEREERSMRRTEGRGNDGN